MKARVLFRRQPDKTRTKVRSILIEVPPEECRHEQRHYGHRPAKMRQFRLQPQVRLIVTIAVDCQIAVCTPIMAPTCAGMLSA